MPNVLLLGTSPDEPIEHWIQSEYAGQFLLINGVSKSRIKVVRDYLNPAFLTKAVTVEPAAKRDIIAYNPSKGFEFTQKLMKAAPELDWRPIKNMTPEQVQALLAQAKVYIDFGHHPGRDRIPREAAVSGCVIVTGRRGSAANNIDIAIDDSFKFNDIDENVPRIIERIKQIFVDFPTELEKQKSYREEIMREPETFAREVESACEFVEPIARPLNVAALQNITEEKNLFAFNNMLRTMKNFKLNFMVSDLNFMGGAVRH